MIATRMGLDEPEYQFLNELLHRLMNAAIEKGVVYIETADFILVADVTDAGPKLFGKKKKGD